MNIALIALLMSPVAGPQDDTTYRLGWNFEAGQKYTFKITQVEQERLWLAEKKKWLARVDWKLTLNFKFEVTEVTDKEIKGEITVTKFSVKEGKENRRPFGRKVKQAKSILKKRQVGILRFSTGKDRCLYLKPTVTTADSEGAVAVNSFIGPQMDSIFVRPPDKDFKVGDTWGRKNEWKLTEISREKTAHLQLKFDHKEDTKKAPSRNTTGTTDVEVDLKDRHVTKITKVFDEARTYLDGGKSEVKRTFNATISRR